MSEKNHAGSKDKDWLRCLRDALGNPPKLPSWARILLTLLIAGWIFPKVDWLGLRISLSRCDGRLLFLAFCSSGLAFLLSTTRWRLLLSRQEINLPWILTARLALIGLFFNLFMLGSTGGDAAKFFVSIKHAPNRKGRLLLSLMQDRLMGLGGHLLVLTAFIGRQRLVLWSHPALRPFVAGVPAACGIFLLLLPLGRLWVRLESHPQPNDSFGVFQVLKSVGQIPFLATLGLAVAIHLASVSSGYFAARSMGIGISYLQAGLVFELTALALVLPITVAGLGVREGVLIWLLGIFGFDATGSAFGVSECLLGINLVWAGLGMIAFYRTRGNEVQSHGE
jgi:uncharacterized membrane protein YbhN (UPF0104 family)